MVRVGTLESVINFRKQITNFFNQAQNSDFTILLRKIQEAKSRKIPENYSFPFSHFHVSGIFRPEVPSPGRVADPPREQHV